VERRDLWDHPGVEDFWRTLVGDQSWTGRDLPRYYRLILKNEYTGKKDIDLETPINYHKCQPAIAVCRRVQAVIWGRKLMNVQLRKRPESTRPEPTEVPLDERQFKALGLAPEQAEKDDLVCILYGCTVPVVLRKHVKSEKGIQSEKEQQQKQREDEARKKIEGFILNTCYRVRLEKAIQWLKEEEAGKRLRATPTGRSRGHPPAPASKRPKKRATIDEDSLSRSAKRKRSNRQASTTLSPDLSRTSGFPHVPEESIEFESRQPLPRRTSSMPANRVEQPPESDKTVFYQMIGECYVHGMMNGEAIDHQNVEELRRTTFEIR
jgi:hypothetical protein